MKKDTQDLDVKVADGTTDATTETEATPERAMGRRQLGKLLAAGGAGLAVALLAPPRWSAPRFALGVLPAHAACSGTGPNGFKADSEACDPSSQESDKIWCNGQCGRVEGTCWTYNPNATVDPGEECDPNNTTDPPTVPAGATCDGDAMIKNGCCPKCKKPVVLSGSMGVDN